MRRTQLLGCCLLAFACTRDLELPPEAGPGVTRVSGRLVRVEPLTGKIRPAEKATIEILGTSIRTEPTAEGFFGIQPPEDRAWQLLARSACDDTTNVCALQALLASEDLAIASGDNNSVGDVVLDPNGSISGQVFLPQGDPDRDLGGIFVFVAGSPFRTFSAADGSYRLDNLPAGRHVVNFFRVGYAPAASGRVLLSPSEDRRIDAVTLRKLEDGDRRGAIVGLVQREDRRDGSVELKALDTLGGEVSDATSDTRATPVPFRVEVPEGLFDVRFTIPGYGAIDVVGVFVDGRAGALETDLGLVTVRSGSYLRCPSGFRIGARGCEDIDECALGICGVAECENTVGSFLCGACPTGWRRDAAQGCVDIQECDEIPGRCLPGVCENVPGAFTCHCPDGWGALDGTCADVDECAGLSGRCGAGTCMDTDGSFACVCDPGHDHPTPQDACVDVDECALDIDGCDPATTCHNSPGGYTCSDCPDGYSQTPDHTCVDIDECERFSGICGDGACTNVPGGHVCDCPAATTPQRGTCEPAPRLDLWSPRGGAVNAMRRSGDTLMLGGSFTYVGPRQARLAVRGASGAPLPTPEVNGDVFALVSDGEGGWFIGGDFTRVGAARRERLAHLRADGSLDPGWNPGAGDRVRALALVGDRLLVGGDFQGLGGFQRRHLGALDAADGSLLGWAPEPDGPAGVIRAGSQGLFVGGAFSTFDGASRRGLVALEPESLELLDLDAALDGDATALALDGDVLRLGGTFTSLGGQPRSRLGALDLRTGEATSWAPSVTAGASCAGEVVEALAVMGETTFVGGCLGAVNGFPRSGIAAVDGTSGATLGWNANLGSGATVHALEVVAAGLAVGGGFESVAAATHASLVVLDPQTAAATSDVAAHGGDVFALGSAGGALGAAGGSFASGLGVARAGIAAIDLEGGAATAFAPRVNGAVETLAVSGGRLYAGGSFTTVDGVKRLRLAAFDDGRLADWNPGAGGTVTSLEVGGRYLFVAGYLTNVDGQSRNYLASFDASSGVLTSWNPSPNLPVTALSYAGGQVWVAGQFDRIGGQSQFSGLAALHPASGVPSSWKPAIDAFVTGMKVLDDTVVIAGRFSKVGGQERQYLAGVRTDDGSVTSLAPQLNGDVKTLDAMDGRVFIGGAFTTVNGQGRTHLAALDASDGSLLRWNPELAELPVVLLADEPRLLVGSDSGAALSSYGP